MSIFPLTASEFFLFLMMTGLVLLVCVYIPVQLLSKVRRILRSRTHITCRICGYRYLVDSPRSENKCPHCDSQN